MEVSVALDEAHAVTQSAWPRFLRGFVVATPFVAYLVYMRATGETRFVSYTLPLIGDLPNGALFDLALLSAVLAAWSIAAGATWSRRLATAILVPVVGFIILFRAVDHYYYYATRSNFNAYVLYSNAAMVQEGVGVVASAPAAALAAIAVVLHFALYAWWGRYASLVNHASAWVIEHQRLAIGAIAAMAILVLVNVEALAVHPQRRQAAISLSGEYQLLSGLPTFLRERARTATVSAPKPAHFYLPNAAPLPTTVASAGETTSVRRPDVVLITIESFNALYALPAKELNPALAEDVMPFFRSLSSEGLDFSAVYTSAAYTFNGIVSVLCSQYTMAEAVWGRGCLPDVLTQAGYDPFAFIAIDQLRPYRYDNFQTMGFDRSHVFDAVRMRHGKKNVYFNFLTDKELFDYAAGVADSVARVPNRRPVLLYMSTNQMHVPGMLRATTCSGYPFPPGLAVDGMTKTMLGSARCTDRDLGQLMARLKADGMYDDALIIITADHAFNISFWNHSESELARIPLFVKLPRGGRRPAVNTGQVAGQINIAPTILDYLGLHTDRAMYGQSLFGPPDPARRVLGISQSRLLSVAGPNGVALYAHGQADYSGTMARNFSVEQAGARVTDRATRDELESLFATVLYFDQHPSEFAETAKREAPARRGLVGAR